jgi:hypothetical protein
MTNNQLTVPETSEESNVQSNLLLQQVLDNPGELAPSVQVRFAKRVGRPGASRVMMMDAQTSGPMGEQDEESESKLALRLADGTNVQLSLSFFNDNQPALANVGGGGRRPNFTPFNTYVYEPRTYTIHKSESKLPLIMMTTAIVLGATCYGLITGPLSNYFQSKATKSTTSVAAKEAVAKPGMTTRAAAKTVTSQHAEPKIAHEAIPEAPETKSESSNSFATGAKKASVATKISHHHSAQMQFAKAGHSTRSEMFVPPPPPMAFASPPSARGFVPPPPPTPYTMPIGIPAAFDPLQSLAPAVAHSNRVYSPTKKLEQVSYTTSAPIENTAPVQQFSPRVERAFEKPASIQDYSHGGGQPLPDEQGLTAPIK